MIRKISAVAVMAVLGGMPFAAAQEEKKESLRAMMVELEGQAKELQAVVGHRTAFAFNTLAFDELGGGVSLAVKSFGEFEGAAPKGSRVYKRVVEPGSAPEEFRRADAELEKVLETLKEKVEEMPK